MARLHIDFEWWRDPEGYRLLDREPPKPPRMISVALPWLSGPAVTLPEGLLSRDWGKPQRIVRRGGNLIPYRPLIEFDGLFRQFASVAATPEGVLDFIEKFGPLTLDGLDEERGQDVPLMIEHVEAMSKFLGAYSRVHKAGLAQKLGAEGIRLGAIKAALVVDPATRTPRLQLSVSDLLTALWVQLGHALSSSGAAIRRCKQCGVWFEAGPGAGRRLDAKFCSDDHRIAFNSLKRSNGR